jgi:hypothetical protein
VESQEYETDSNEEADIGVIVPIPYKYKNDLATILEKSCSVMSSAEVPKFDLEESKSNTIKIV